MTDRKPTPRRRTAFAAHVLHIVRRIPPGRVTTYGDVAALAGRPGAARAVGSILRQAEEPGLPYHRVVAAAGRLGGFGGHRSAKRDRLAREGALVRRNRIVNFVAIHWRGR